MAAAVFRADTGVRGAPNLTTTRAHEDFISGENGMRLVLATRPITLAHEAPRGIRPPQVPRTMYFAVHGAGSVMFLANDPVAARAAFDFVYTDGLVRAALTVAHAVGAQAPRAERCGRSTHDCMRIAHEAIAARARSNARRARRMAAVVARGSMRRAVGLVT
jgi:hypothetical protein